MREARGSESERETMTKAMETRVMRGHSQGMQQPPEARKGKEMDSP